jgi:hypothetical protein
MEETDLDMGGVWVGVAWEEGEELSVNARVRASSYSSNNASWLICKQNRLDAEARSNAKANSPGVDIDSLHTASCLTT